MTVTPLAIGMTVLELPNCTKVQILAISGDRCEVAIDETVAWLDAHWVFADNLCAQDRTAQSFEIDGAIERAARDPHSSQR